MNPSSMVADLIAQLMLKGKSGGLPMEASPELRAYMQASQGSAPDVDSFAADNVELFHRGYTPEHPVHISRDPWFDEAQTEASTMPPMSEPPPPTNPYAAQGRAMQGEPMGQELVIYFVKPDGSKVALDGPYTDREAALSDMDAFKKASPGVRLFLGPKESPA